MDKTLIFCPIKKKFQPIFIVFTQGSFYCLPRTRNKAQYFY
ncbi:hypothetical protein THERMOS_1789 [Bathymodiolus thermophilus thioautotrophic gill symbiont]|uniref:Uncharacterized protein n=1 Tax=Bathymodiolus thermophilus thioautotrophic gill symbiont TaxID=2360 RepID=A0A8H8XCG1_9GAMM|nr:hypothetical protein THERMOS_1789 [Bathymodiolus thermophilus thioautotrophic gill symbiont]